MQKLFLIIFFILMSVALAGCNLPTTNNSMPNDLATQVTSLLTSSPSSQESPIGNLPNDETDTPEKVSTSSPEPNFTETIIEPTFTPTEELVSDELPEGPPTWSDPFNDGTRFGINSDGYDDGQTRIEVTNGEMVLTSITGSGWRGWRLTSQKPTNYYLKANFETDECAESDQYGLVVQSPDYASGSGYYFGLTCNGRFAFQKWDDDGLSNIIGWETDPNINVGSNQSNSIGIKKKGNQYFLYINSIKITDIEDEMFSSPGYFGPFIAGVNTANFTVRMNNIEYWNLP